MPLLEGLVEVSCLGDTDLHSRGDHPAADDPDLARIRARRDFPARAN